MAQLSSSNLAVGHSRKKSEMDGNGLKPILSPRSSSSGNLSKEDLSRKWDSQFEEIQNALDDTRSRNPELKAELDALSDDRLRLAKMSEVFDLKNLALEGMETKLREATAELAETKKQLAQSNKLYFHSLVLNLRMHQLYSKGVPAKNIDAGVLFEQCMNENIPVAQWPTFVTNHFSS